MRVGWALALFVLSCSEAPVEPMAPVGVVRGVVHFAPQRLRVGDVATVEVAVVTPPHTELGEIRWPANVPGLSFIETLALETERETHRWVHRGRMRVRAIEIGQHRWPETQLEVRPADGERGELVLAGDTFEIVSTLSTRPDQLSAFGLRDPTGEASQRDLALAAAAGAAGALACVALFLVLRRRTKKPSRTTAAEIPAEPGRVAEAELARALELLALDPHASAQCAGSALRAFAVHRFGAPIETRTTEELALMRPPRNMRSRWKHLIEILARLDDVRFRPASAEPPRDALASTLEAAREFVRDASPERS